MAIRPLLLGLAVSGMAVPAMAQPVLPAATALATIQHAQSATYSISNVQSLLNRLGYDAGPIDGLMGSRTQSAIVAYQRDRGLPVTGQPSGDLYADMLAASGSGATATATTPTSGSTMITSGETVVEVQTELRRRGYDIDVITGQWDVPTRDAILVYQRDAGLAATGVVDEALAESLRTTASLPSAEQRALVRGIQEALKDRGYNTGPVDGTMSPLTASAIRTYEADAGLPVTGTASPALLARLEGTGTTAPVDDTATVRAVQEELITRGYLQGKADGRMGARTSAAIREFEQDAGLAVTGTASTALLTSLRASDLTWADANRGQILAEIEEELRLKGYRVGPVDGELDPQSEAAIRAFQQDAGLTVDGRATTRLLSTIRSSDVAAAPMTREEAVQGLIEGATTRLLGTIVTPSQQPTE
ncbi:MAG TPA: peptidoglycan-binding domain-containing protein [Thermohalobaculum sp.]|nr:peptidoglycan-binding domain-containing protein [Thermohalobaculum sp.]